MITFTYFYTAKFDFAYAVAYAYLYDKSLVEDVLQEVFLVAFTKYRELNLHPNVDGWLVKATPRNSEQSKNMI